eukprot:CAMPEP_0172712618 /NCGR_PEP_ID=MMETSP1074-20121228/61204_1 /TAXON_ID=2916 /ORGANISM="Ceratium fusus, Strain PA161109" /LENGTH=146 /DNA_ID=CAMNT_0013536571 /DNA_START=22 /DNA_END=459 /DNA_ORIENTATION=+
MTASWSNRFCGKAPKSKWSTDTDASTPLMESGLIPSVIVSPGLFGRAWWCYVMVTLIGGVLLGAGADYWAHRLIGGTWCDKTSFTKTTLLTVIDSPVFGLLPDAGEEFRFEVSSVVIAEHGYYAVCDSSWSIPAIHDLGATGSFTN